MKAILFNSFFANSLFLFTQTRKVLFSGKFFYFLGFVVLFDLFIIVLGHIFNEPFPPTESFIMLNLLPMMVLALYLSMVMVSDEKDNRTIETLFSVPGSPYKVWLYKLTILYTLLLLVQLTLILMIFFFVTDFRGYSVFSILLYGFAPIFLVTNLNFYLSTVLKSGYAAGLISLIVLFFNFVLIDVLEYSKWFLYLNPLHKPDSLDLDIWNSILLYNKLGVTLIGILFMYLGLRRLLNREPFVA